MNPCLADTGSTLPVTLIAIAVVAIVGGTALFFVARHKKKRAIGTTTLALVLFGALAIGITPPTPAHAATGTECTQTAVPAQTSTPTPTPTRTTPAPTCTPAVINDDVDSWMTYYIDETSTAKTLNGLTTNPTLLAALHTGTVYNGTLVVAEGGTTTFNGAVTFTAVPQSSAATLIAVSVADLPQGVPSMGSTVTLSFQIPGASTCPTKVTVTSTFVVPE